MHLTNADLLAVERELCRRSLAEFAKRAWHVLEPSTPLEWGWALDAICKHLEAVTDGKITRLLINVPPGCMKSLLVGVLWPAWEWGPRDMQEMRFIGTAHEEGLAIRDSRRCRDLIKSDWYQSLWPVVLASDLDGKREFGNSRKGFRLARSFTSMTGARGDRVILDDPISAHNANSVAHLEAARLAFTETLSTRVNSQSKSAIVVIMQRLHEKDVSGIILELGLPYVHLCIPMKFEPERRCLTSIGWEDPRTNEGELMFPERFNEHDVAALEADLGSYATAGQLQQRPTPRGGGILKREWYQYYSHLPAIEFRFITADTAQKKDTRNDYSVMQCWGRSTVGKAVLIDQVRGKWEAPELLITARSFWLKHLNEANPVIAKSVLRGFYVEDKVSGTGLIQTLRREGIPMMAVQRSLDKTSRAYDAAPFIESGNVLLPQDASWLSDFLAESDAFSPGKSHDDQLDPMFDAINIVQRTPAIKPAQAQPIPVMSKW